MLSMRSAALLMADQSLLYMQKIAYLTETQAMELKNMLNMPAVASLLCQSIAAIVNKGDTMRKMFVAANVMDYLLPSLGEVRG